MQDTNMNRMTQTPAARKDEAMRALQQTRRDRAQAASADADGQRKGVMGIVAAFLIDIFTLRIFRRRASRKQELLQAVVRHDDTLFATHTESSIAFRGSSASTLATPIGSYAGKPPSLDLRKLAEKQFHEMDSSRGSTIN